MEGRRQAKIKCLWSKCQKFHFKVDGAFHRCEEMISEHETLDFESTERRAGSKTFQKEKREDAYRIQTRTLEQHVDDSTKVGHANILTSAAAHLLHFSNPTF